MPREAIAEYQEPVEDRETDTEDCRDAWDAFVGTLQGVDWDELDLD
ncbi:MAG: hypothetical protein Q7K03_09175 [Dehalococcoidia bacterium]|nr:hypothetical protein [Dehalococcoidia bacterium]